MVPSIRPTCVTVEPGREDDRDVTFAVRPPVNCRTVVLGGGRVPDDDFFLIF